MRKLIEKLRVAASDFVASCIATWRFVFLYTGVMIGWIALHKTGILNVDSENFQQYNLLLSWAAGIQASVILMVTNRQTEKDRILNVEGHECISRKAAGLAEKMNTMYGKLDKIERIILMMEEEENEKQIQPMQT